METVAASELSAKTEELMLVRAAKRELDDELKQAAEMELELRYDIIRLMNTEGLEAFRNKNCQITKTIDNKPEIEDYDKLVEYIIETKSFDILQKRLASNAVRERWEHGLLVPGVKVEKVYKLSVRSVQ